MADVAVRFDDGLAAKAGGFSELARRFALTLSLDLGLDRTTWRSCVSWCGGAGDQFPKICHLDCSSINLLVTLWSTTAADLGRRQPPPP